MRTAPDHPTPARARRLLAATALLGAGVLGVASCSSDAPARDDIVDALVVSGLSKEAAECTADALVDSLTDEELTELAERGGGGAPVDDPTRTDDSADQLRDAINECRPLVTTTTTTTVPEGGATTSTTVAPDDGGASGGAGAGDGASLDPAPTTTP